MNPALALLSGIVAAFTPCVVVLFPLVLYRFYSEQKLDWRKLTLFSVAFIFGFLILGILVSQLLTSSIQNGFKLGLGFLFITLGMLAFTGRLNPLQLPVIQNPLLFGFLFSVIITVNPCVVPYLGALLSLSSVSNMVLQVLLFSLGLLAPILVFGVIGQQLFTHIQKRSGKILHSVHKLMSVVLILSGIYLIFSIYAIQSLDMYALSIILFFIFAVIIKSFFLVNKVHDLLRPDVIILLLSLIILIYAILNHCASEVNAETLPTYGTPETMPTCLAGNQNILGCPLCRQCVYVFVLALVIGTIGILLTYYGRYKRKS